MEGQVKIGDVVEVWVGGMWYKSKVEMLESAAVYARTIAGTLYRVQGDDVRPLLSCGECPETGACPSCDEQPREQPTMPSVRDLLLPPELTSEGVKHDAAKPDWSLVQPLTLEACVRVLTFGAQKYAPDNWRRVPRLRRRYFAAALRHIMAWWRGELLDPETGEPHLAHAICCLAFLCELQLEGNVQ